MRAYIFILNDDKYLFILSRSKKWKLYCLFTYNSFFIAFIYSFIYLRYCEVWSFTSLIILLTPKQLKHRGALVWLVLASVHEARDNLNRVANYRRFETTISMDGTPYPLKLRDIDRFENLNVNISVNVFAYGEKKIFLVRITNVKGREHHMNLLVITDNEIHHFILVKILNRLLIIQYKRYNGRLYFCPYCQYWTGQWSRNM